MVFQSSLSSTNNLDLYPLFTLLLDLLNNNPPLHNPQRRQRPKARNRSESSQYGAQTEDAVKFQVSIKHVIERALRLDIPEADHRSSDRDGGAQNDEPVCLLVSDVRESSILNSQNRAGRLLHMIRNLASNGLGRIANVL